MDMLERTEKVLRAIAKLTPAHIAELNQRMQKDQADAIRMAREMRDIYHCCPAHGLPIMFIRKSNYKIGNEEFDFDTIQCARRGYPEADISNDLKLLETLAQMVPFSQEKPFSQEREPDLKKATVSINDFCPYCGEQGGELLAYAHIGGMVLQRTLTKREMNCGHEYAIMYHII